MSGNVVFLGNCHANALSIVYRDHIAPLQGQSVAFVHAGRTPPQERDRIVSGADVLVVQKMWFPLEILPEILKPTVLRCDMPTVGCRFLWPFANRAHPNNPTPPFCPAGPYGHDLGDSFLNGLIGAGATAEEAVRTYLELDIVREANLDRLFEMCIEASRQLDAQTGFNLTAFVERNFRDEALFMTPGHLTRRLFGEMIRQVFARIHVPSASIEQAIAAQHAPFGVTQLPIHPGIIEHFGLKYVDANSRYRYFDEGQFTFSEYALRYVRCEWNYDLAEGIAASAGTDPARALRLLERGLQRAPNSARGLLCRAKVLMRMGRPSEAEACARKAMEFDTEAPDGPRTLSAILSRRGDHDGAASAARHAIALLPADASSHYSLALVLADGGDMDGAVQAAQRAAALKPGNPHLHAAVANLLLRSGDFAGAEQAYGKAAELGPGVPSFRSGLIEALIRQGKRERAVAVLRTLIVENIPDAQLFCRLGHLLFDAGELSGAEQAFRTAAGIDPAMRGLGSTLADVLARQGKREDALVLPGQLAATLIRQGKHEEALAALRQFAASGAADAVSYARLGQMLLHSGDAAGAEQAFREALQASDSAAPQFRRMLADALYLQGKQAEALDTLRRLAADGSADPQTYMRLGQMLLQSRDLEGAEATLRKAAELDPVAPRIRAMLADVLCARGEREEAVRMLRQLASEGAADGRTHALLAQLLLQARDLDGAEQAYRKAAELDPASAALRSALAEVLVRQGKQDEALVLLRQLVAEGATDTRIHSRVGQLLLRLGDPDGAERAFRRAIALNPNDLQLHSALMALLIGQNRRDDAIAALGEMVAHGAAAPQAHGLLGRILFQSSDLSKAEQAFRTAIELDPNEDSYRLHLAGVLMQQGRQAEGFAALCELNAAGNIRGDLALKIDAQSRAFGGGPEVAESAIQKALRANPGSPALYGALAEVMHRQGRSDEALGLLLSLVNDGMRDAHVYARIGWLRAVRGNPAGAADAMQQAIELAPNIARFRDGLAGIIKRRAGEAEATAAGAPAPASNPGREPAVAAQ